MSFRVVPVALLVVLVATSVAVGGAVLMLSGDRAPARPVTPAPARTEVAAAALLRTWDERRAEAWASGDPVRLRPLYAVGSTAGRTDRAMLRAWAGRGLRVEDLRMQLYAVRVRLWTADRVVLVVTDRVVGGVAVGVGGRQQLPADGISTRLVALAWVAGEWRVDAVS